MTLSGGLAGYHQQGFCSFHTPGHKGRQEFFHGLKFPSFDLTELSGLDNLHAPTGIIAAAQRRAAEIFGAEESFFLVNGSTVGNQAMLMALGDTKGKPVLVGRQAHRSVMAGLVLSGLRPQYMMPVMHPDFNLPLGMQWTEASIRWEDGVACHLTYPTYYGTTPDLAGLLAIRTGESGVAGGQDNPGRREDKGRGALPFLVDQAHGSHYLGSLFPPSALTLGADLVVTGLHKTLSALTQSAMLHAQGHLVNRTRLRSALEMLQSSSPSYLLMASLELASEFARQQERWQVLREEVELLYRKTAGFLRVLTSADAGTYGIAQVDWSKILINTRPLGVWAPDCVEHLRRDHGIEPELWDQENILFVLGIGNTPQDVRVLIEGLESLPGLRSRPAGGNKRTGIGPESKGRCFDREGEPGERTWPALPRQLMTPREAFQAPKRRIPLAESRGQIAGETVSPYPPGIPLVVMGEELSAEAVEALVSGCRQGWQGFKDGTILVVDR